MLSASALSAERAVQTDRQESALALCGGKGWQESVTALCGGKEWAGKCPCFMQW